MKFNKRLFAVLCMATISYGSIPYNIRQQIRIKSNLKTLSGSHKPHLSGGNDDPTPIMIEKAGYPSETHIVKTDDCYILEVHRIPHGRNNSILSPGEKRPVVFLQHGLMGASDNWVISIDYPEKSLGFILADAGYDVWLGNYRGNTYARAHCSLDPEELEFWLFSWDEMAQYDLPAMINQVLDTTGADNIFYIGHSLGTTAFMAMTNLHPEMNDKIILASLLAPVAFVEHMRSPIGLLAPVADLLEGILESLGIGEFFPSNKLMDILADIVCAEDYVPVVCESVMFLLMGFDAAQMNQTLLDTIVHHSPAGSSARAIVHYAQEVNSGRFCRYDFGRKKNQEIYGQDTPPSYDIGNVTVPIAAYWSNNDWLAEPIDVLRLTSELPNLVTSYEVPYPKWNHLDYLWGIDADKYVYQELLRNMEEMKRTLTK